MHTQIWITTSFIGYHFYPDAPEEVSYLRFIHRHCFNVKVGVYVGGDNREVEFHMLKAEVERIIDSNVKPYMTKHAHLSCEMVARRIHDALCSRFAISEVSVDEDGECGAVISFPPHEAPIR